MSIPIHLTTSELEAGLEHIRQSPGEQGKLEMIVCRPGTDQRRVLEAGELTLQDGLVGDDWRTRGSSRTPDGSAHPEMQLNLMNARAIALVAGDRQHWQLAGDQLFVDLDLSLENLPPGTRLAIGTAVLEITAPPHTGCRKFAARFGADAMQFVNSPAGKALRLRGVNARVLQPGKITPGDLVHKLA